jgi:hypothetical protein
MLYRSLVVVMIILSFLIIPALADNTPDLTNMTTIHSPDGYFTGVVTGKVNIIYQTVTIEPTQGRLVFSYPRNDTYVVEGGQTDYVITHVYNPDPNAPSQNTDILQQFITYIEGIL